MQEVTIPDLPIPATLAEATLRETIAHGLSQQFPNTPPRDLVVTMDAEKDVNVAEAFRGLGVEVVQSQLPTSHGVRLRSASSAPPRHMNRKERRAWLRERGML